MLDLFFFFQDTVYKPLGFVWMLPSKFNAFIF